MKFATPKNETKSEAKNEAKVEVTSRVEPCQAAFKDKTPANWCITKTEDGQIVAFNSSTSETYQGSLASFNMMLKG